MVFDGHYHQRDLRWRRGPGPYQRRARVAADVGGAQRRRQQCKIWRPGGIETWEQRAKNFEKLCVHDFELFKINNFMFTHTT